jgi:hypothetical protein
MMKMSDKLFNLDLAAIPQIERDGCIWYSLAHAFAQLQPDTDATFAFALFTQLFGKIPDSPDVFFAGVEIEGTMQSGPFVREAALYTMAFCMKTPAAHEFQNQATAALIARLRLYGHVSLNPPKTGE